MNKAELESKSLAELHSLAADAGVERYRMLSRDELVERLAVGGGEPGPRPERKRAPRRGRRDSRGGP
ncbi:MAG: Rho termination factor N-terminal domain-containing protein, partial [Solirubrobacterales bacterium]